MLSDALDEGNAYIVATIAGQLAGFISITPPELGQYSIEKYLGRDELPILLDDRTYEVRVLTVAPAHRNSGVASYLMYGAFRWIEEHGGEQIIGMGRDEVLSIYRNFGAQLLGRRIVSGSVTYELMMTSVSHLQRFSVQHQAKIDRRRGACARGRRRLDRDVAGHCARVDLRDAGREPAAERREKRKCGGDRHAASWSATTW